MSMFAMAAAAASHDAQQRMDRAQNSTAKSQGSSALKQQLRWLEANLAKSLMINEALWELIRDKLNLTQQDLDNKLYEIDMRNGQLDGKNQRPPVKCPKCNRTVSPRHPACLYCGAIIDDSVFTMS